MVIEEAIKVDEDRYANHRLDASFPFASREAVYQAIQTGAVKWGRFEKREVEG